jgi:O-antigen/teichoic acid export membrane protein
MSTLLNKYFHQPKPVKAAFWFTVCNIIPKCISLFTAPLYIRLLTTEQYGTYIIYASWVGIVSVFATLNIGAAGFYNGIQKYEVDRNAYTSTMQGLSTITTIVVFLIYVLFRKYMDVIFRLPPVLMMLMFFQCLFSPAFIFWSMCQRFDFKYRLLITINLAMVILSPLASIFYIQQTAHKGEALVAGIFGTQTIIFSVFYIYNFLNGRRFYDKEYWKFVLNFNLPLIPHYLSGIILGQADRLMIDQLVGREQGGIYGFAYNLSWAISVFISGVNASFVPWVYQMLKLQRYNDVRKIVNILVVFFAIITLFFVLVAPEMVHVIATPQYYNAIWIIPPVALSTFIVFVYESFGIINFYFKATKLIMIGTSVGAISNILLNLFCIPRYGYITSGYTTMISHIIIAIAYYLFMRKVCLRNDIGKYQIFDIRFILIVAIGLLSCSVFLMLLYNLIIPRYIIIMVGMCFFIIKRKMFIGMFKSIKLK